MEKSVQLISILESGLTILDYLSTKCIVNLLTSSSDLLAYNRISRDILYRIFNEGIKENYSMSKCNIAPYMKFSQCFDHVFSYDSIEKYELMTFMPATIPWSIKEMKKMMLMGKKELRCCFPSRTFDISRGGIELDEYGMVYLVAKTVSSSSLPSKHFVVFHHAVKTCYHDDDTYTIYPVQCDKCDRGITTNHLR